MKNKQNSSEDAEVWESGKLGTSEEHVKPVSRGKTEEIQDALGLQPVTVRLQKELVEQLKMEKLKRAIQIGIEQVERSELIDGDEVFRHLRKRNATMREQGSQ